MSCCAARGRRGARSRFTRREILRGTPAILLATLAGCTVRRDAAELPPVTQPPVQVVQPPRFVPTPTPPPTPRRSHHGHRGTRTGTARGNLVRVVGVT